MACRGLESYISIEPQELNNKVKIILKNKILEVFCKSILDKYNHYFEKLYLFKICHGFKQMMFHFN